MPRMRGRRPPNPAAGFTLIEVLAAIALLAIAFAVGLGAIGKSARNAAHAVALDGAVERAQTLLTGQGLGAPLHEATLDGRFDDGSDWSLHVHKLPKPAAAPGAVDAVPTPATPDGAMVAQASAIDLYQLDVAVHYGAGHVLRLSTLRAQAAETTSQ